VSNINDAQDRAKKKRLVERAKIDWLIALRGHPM